jgi:hypothetical protein
MCCTAEAMAAALSDIAAHEVGEGPMPLYGMHELHFAAEASSSAPSWLMPPMPAEP